MGNNTSIDIIFNTNNNDSNNLENKKTDICLLCWEDIQKNNLTACSKCNIQMHHACYINYNKRKNHKHSACPNCHKVCSMDQEIIVRQCVFERKGNNAYYGRQKKIYHE